MLTIILSILKIIGLILFWILAILLGIILLICFWPFFYKVDLVKLEDIKGRFGISWFFHVLVIEAYYRDEFNVRLRLFGIPVYDRNRKLKSEIKREEVNKRKKQSAQNKSVEDTSVSDETVESKPVEETVNESVNESDNESGKEVLIEKPRETTAAQGDRKQSEQNKKETNKKVLISDRIEQIIQKVKQIFCKIIDFLESIPERLEHWSDKLEGKIDKLVETIDYYENLFAKKGTRWVIDFCKKECLLLIRHLKPYYSKVWIKYGSDDPAAIAKVMEYYAMVMPWLPRHTTLETSYQENCLEIEGVLKGRFILLYVVLHAGKLVLNKNVKKFIKLLKREEV